MYMRKSMRDLTTAEEKRLQLDKKRLELEKNKYNNKLFTENKKRSKRKAFQLFLFRFWKYKKNIFFRFKYKKQSNTGNFTRFFK